MFNILHLFATAIPFIASSYALSVRNAGLNTTAAYADVVATSPAGNIAAVQDLSGDTRLYFQDCSTGDIMQYDVNNAFNTGTLIASAPIVPASQVKTGTPIAASVLVNSAGGYEAVHVYFFSPDNILSEAIWQAGVASPGPFQVGSTCTKCITQSGFVGAGAGDVLYAMENADTNELRVGFISAASPTTITEAINSGSGWALSPLN